MLSIEEGDSPDRIRHKIEQHASAAGERHKTVLPWLGSLYAINRLKTAALEPEIVKSRLHQAVKAVFTVKAERAPTVICLEDIHWADPSSAELIHAVTSAPDFTALYVPGFDPSFIALRGSAEETAVAAREFKIFYHKVAGKTPTSYTMDHTAGAYVFDRQGRVRLFVRHGAGVSDIVADLRHLL